MAKQLTILRYIMKISSSRLVKAKWDLTLPLEEAQRNNEVIGVGSSQMIRWIDELNGVPDRSEEYHSILSVMRKIKRGNDTVGNRHTIAKMQKRLDEIQFIPDMIHLYIEKTRDYRRACRGFKINGVEYARLLGTNGGVKTQTIIFVAKRLVTELRTMIDNNRNMEVPQIPAKLEAYRALTCSGSTPVSMPHGILVVPDCETTFKEDIVILNDENSDEPELTYVKDSDITLDESDGYGLMCPALAERWSNELELGYTASGMNTRCSWEKGMVFCFDFHKFAEEVAHQEIVTDAWGNQKNIHDVELILTTSMLKLWKCYDSIEDYVSSCEKNHYTFGVPKTCPKALEKRRALNYQFIQSYNLPDSEIEELIRPTIDEIKDVLGGDYRKTLLFLRGQKLTEDNAELLKDYPSLALMACPEIIDDPLIIRHVHDMIRMRIQRAKVGVISVHGNYSILCGDPYALCQSMFGLKVTGLLKAGEVYNKYWADTDAEQVAAYRAPMTSMGNIKIMKVARGDEVSYWYQHMTTCTMLNAWDTTAQALNGADKDGDLIFLTDNPVLVRNHEQTPTIYCVQRTAEKKIVTEEDLINANIASFGDDIGRTTNYITSMFDVRAQFPPDSEEYKTLSYRIECGQLFQQNRYLNRVHVHSNMFEKSLIELLEYPKAMYATA